MNRLNIFIYTCITVIVCSFIIIFLEYDSYNTFPYTYVINGEMVCSESYIEHIWYNYNHKKMITCEFISDTR
jgi:hypothetical protein